jgi:hypothetical protein
MAARIPRIVSALKFFINIVLICVCRSQLAYLNLKHFFNNLLDVFFFCAVVLQSSDYSSICFYAQTHSQKEQSTDSTSKCFKQLNAHV